MSDTSGTNNNTSATPVTVTYGGVQDRPGDVNHPDNLAPVGVSTDPAAPTGAHTAAPTVPDDFRYDPATDTYVRNAPVTEHYEQ